MDMSDQLYYVNILANILTNLYKFVQPICFILGNIGNLLTAFVFWRKTWRKNVCVLYFKVYLISNTCYINSSLLGSTFIYGYNIHLQNTNIVLCKAFYYSAFLFAIHPPTILILASIDRLLISSQNVDTRLYSSKRLAYFSIGLSTFFWIVFNVHILIMVHIQELYPSVFVCYYDLSSSYQNFVYYYLAIVNICFCFIMIVLCLLSFKNIRHIQVVPRQQRNQRRTMTKKDFQLLRCLFAHGIVYIIFRIGINLYYGYDAITRGQQRSELRRIIEVLINDFLTFLFNASYCLSFFIYISISKTFRHELKRILWKVCGKDVMPMREEENRQDNLAVNAGSVVNYIVPSS
ncbi:hypothetical protein I4U23_026094 [Adineta vaga]|nr:hypothetical protein I4U23_026094 [Adineta vaga]